MEGELCDLRVTSLGWTPGAATGVIDSECVTEIEETVDLQTVAGHADVTQTTVMEAEVMAITGNRHGGEWSIGYERPVRPRRGYSLFPLPSRLARRFMQWTVETSNWRPTLSIPVPPLTQLTHHPERTEYRTKMVSLYRPGTSRDGQRDGHGHPRRRNDDAACRHGHPVDTGRDGEPGT